MNASRPTDASAPMNGPAPTVTILVDGRELEVPTHRTVAAAMMAEAGQPAWRRTRRGGESRGLFCGIGVCYDCLATVDGRPTVRTCLVTVKDGMRVETGTSDAPEGTTEAHDG